MKNKNLEIQSLRGYAILLTIVAHMGPLVPEAIPYLKYFWLGGGVDLFFCISGFVIACGLFERKKESFIAFYLPFLVKRVARLWPAAIFWSLVVLLLSLFFNEKGSFDTVSNNFHMAVAGWFQVVNFKMISGLYFDFSIDPIASPLRIYWSLSLEEQFYIVFPILLFFLKDKRIAILALLMVIAQVFLYRPWPSPLWFFRTDAIFLGVLIAWLKYKGYTAYMAPEFLKSGVLRLISSLILCVLLFAVAKKEVVWFFNGLVVLVAGALVFVASFDRGYFIKPGLFCGIMSYVGERSYSMYLSHLVCIVFLREFYIRVYGLLPVDTISQLGLAVTALFLVVVMSEVSYRYIETPIRNRGRAFRLMKIENRK